VPCNTLRPGGISSSFEELPVRKVVTVMLCRCHTRQPVKLSALSIIHTCRLTIPDIFILTLKIFAILKMVEILITSGLPDGVNYAGEYKFLTKHTPSFYLLQGGRQC
jgi:hypothetical protein